MPELPWLSRCHCLHAKSRHRLCWPHLWPGRYSRGSRFWWLVSLELGVVTGVLIAAGADSHERCRSLGRAWHGHRDRCRFPVIGLDSATEAPGRAQNCKATERPDVAASAWPPLPLQMTPVMAAGPTAQQIRWFWLTGASIFQKRLAAGRPYRGVGIRRQLSTQNIFNPFDKIVPQASLH